MLANATRIEKFMLPQCQPATELLLAFGHARDRRHFKEYQDGIYHEEPHASHRTQFPMRRGAKDEATKEDLWSLINSQDADAILAVCYVLSALAPEKPTEPGQFAGGVIDLEDGMKKTGLLASKPNKEEKDALRMRFYRTILFGERAMVVGRRTRNGKPLIYKDIDGTEIPTEIKASPWRIMREEVPLQSALFPEYGTPAPVALGAGAIEGMGKGTFPP